MKKNYFNFKNKLGFLTLGLAFSAAFQAQTTYSFTPAGATGQNGPTQGQVNTAYNLTNLSGSVTVTNGIQSFTVPSSGVYRIEAYGAQGGPSWGLGAKMTGTLNLTAGTVLKIVAGQQGVSGDNFHGSGGGGSFVVDNSNNPIMIAGGGGGRGNGSTSIQSSSNGGTVTGGQSPPTSGSPGGTGGGGGAAANGSFGGTSTTAGDGSGSDTWASGGGGFYTDGGPYNNSTGTYQDLGGKAFLNGAKGGDPDNGTSNSAGGFGGGGGAGDRGAGGGGYSGGGGGTDDNDGGGGGGSFNSTAAASQTNVAAFNSGNGKVLIILQCDVSITASTTNSVAPLICSGTSVTLTTNGVGNYNWSNGNTTTNSIVVTPTITTTYTVAATGTGGCPGQAAITVSVDHTPTVTAVRSASAVCAGKTVTLTASGATTYTWSNSVLNGITYTPTATNSYTVSGSNACGTVSTTIGVTVNPLPNIGGSVNHPTVCLGDTVIFNGTGSAGGYTWSANVTNSATYIPSFSSNYTVTGVSANSCTNTAVVGQTVILYPNATPVANPAGICLGKSSTITAQQSASTSYTWDVVPIINTNSIAVTPGTTTTYTLYRANGACSTTAMVTVTVYPIPPLTLASTMSPSSACAGAAISGTAFGAVTYTWFSPTNTTLGYTGGTQTFHPNSSTVYTVVASSANCTASATTSVTINQAPSVSIQTSSSVICAGTSVTLTASGAATYTWSNPPGASTQTTIVNSPTASISYSVNATSAGGCPGSQSAFVQVNPLPVITPTLLSPTGSTYICAGQTASLIARNTSTSSPKPVYNYSWAGATGTTSMITASPAATSYYTVTVTDPSTNCKLKDTYTLSVYISTFAVTVPPAFCNGQTTTLVAAGAASSYSWTKGQSATVLSTNDSLAVSPTANTVYYIVGQTGACLSTQSVNVVVNPLPVLTVSLKKTTICRFEPGILTANGTSTSWLWSTTATTPSISVTPTVSTNYTVTGTDGNGCIKTVTVTQFVSACLGIEQLSNNMTDLLTIYPNPSTGDFTIDAQTTMNITVVNETGQVVKRASLDANSQQLNLSNLANGIYFIVAEKDGNTATKKVIVSK